MGTITKKIISFIIFLVIGFGVGFYATKVIDRQAVDSPSPVGMIGSFEECEAAGNPVMESYPRQCRSADGLLFIEEIIVKPSPNDEIFCTTQYDPVCGEVQVQCITEPCYPVKETFSNRCFAEKRGAFNIVDGECE